MLALVTTVQGQQPWSLFEEALDQATEQEIQHIQAKEATIEIEGWVLCSVPSQLALQLPGEEGLQDGTLEHALVQAR